jgi:hypothetical protein
MNVYETPAGTPVLDMTEDEHRAFLEHEVQASVGLSIAEFVERAARGEIDWDDPDAFYVAGILGIGQNGHRAAGS